MSRFSLLLKLGAFALALAAIGLPVNTLFAYALALIAALFIFVSTPRSDSLRWIAAAGIAALALFAHIALRGTPIEEGHNLFVTGPDGAVLERTLPPPVYAAMKQAFDAQYPEAQRCDPLKAGCWRGRSLIEQPYAFSADGVWDAPQMSRRVRSIHFSDAAWAGFGLVNELNTGWYGESDVKRVQRARFSLLHPWQVTVPFFVVYRFPADYAGSALCWRGDVMWEGEGGAFARINHDARACRALTAADAGKQVFGFAIAKDRPLEMRLRGSWSVQAQAVLAAMLSALALVAIVLLTTRSESLRLRMPALWLAFALLTVFLGDATFIGGLRPLDGGDDGLLYDGWAREILRFAQAGDWWNAARGAENVYYYAPGFRYVRAVEHAIFGETFFGYLSLILTLPFLHFLLFRRFLPARWAVFLTLLFVATPIGALLGSSFFQYAKWAARGYADSAGAVFFLCGLILLIGGAAKPVGKPIIPAFFAGLFFALAVFMRPNLAAGTAILLGGAGIAFWRMQLARAVALSAGFAPVFLMTFHNWVFGGVFVLFSSNVAHTGVLAMPPGEYVSALADVARLNWSSPLIAKAARQIAGWLSGTSEAYALIPLHAAAIAIVVRVALSHRYDGWLRLIAVATLAQHAVALFYLSFGRYYLVTWLLTSLIVIVWLRAEGLAIVRGRLPAVSSSLLQPPVVEKVKRMLDWCERQSAGRPAADGRY